jgi:tellurite resistance protein TehA-like permease
MGAMAISTLAGSLLIINAPRMPRSCMSILPFIKGFTVFYWATGTLVGADAAGARSSGATSYGAFHVDATTRMYWGAVFPFGMYAASTEQMIRAMGFDFLEPMPTLFFIIALLAWSLTFLGLLRRISRSRCITR